MRIVSVGHAVFAAVMIALGIIGLVTTGFIPVWEPIPKWAPAHVALDYLCALISLAGGIGLILRGTASVAARVLFATLMLWLLVFRVPFILRSPLTEGPYQFTGETAAVVAGAWVLYAWFAADSDRRRLGFATSDRGVHLARVLYALALIAFGFSHFAYLNLTAPLVPGWLPAHVFWAYFTGAAYLAAGAAILIGVYARLAAVLSVWQMGLFLLLVWVPMLMSGKTGADTWSEAIVNAALVAGGWLVAESYRGMPWLALNKR
jgi:uncharacterized membrane protein